MKKSIFFAFLLLISFHSSAFAQTPVENDLNGTIVGSPSPAAATPTAPSPTPAAPVLSGGLGFVPLAPVPGLTQGVVANSAGTASFLNNLYLYLIGIAAVLAVVEIIWGGLQIATQDSVSKKGEGKKRIWQALMGLALVLSPALVFGIINPAILNMSISMGPLNVQNAAGYVAPVVAPADQVCSGSSCMQQAKANCDAVGGVFSTSGPGGSTAGTNATCYLPNSTTVANQDSITKVQCTALVGHGAAGMQAQPIGKDQAQDCGSASVATLEASYALGQCKNITGGGVCLFGQ